MEARPDGPELRELLVHDLEKTFTVSDVENCGFTLERLGKRVRVHLTSSQLEAYVLQIEESAHAVLGLQHRWASGLSLASVHILEEAALATASEDVLYNGDEIVRSQAS